MRLIVPIVEGPGDEVAAPVLLRRILHERIGRYDLDVLKPLTAKGRGALIKRLEDLLGLAAATDGCSGILVLLDADRDCPTELGMDWHGAHIRSTSIFLLRSCVQSESTRVGFLHRTGISLMTRKNSAEQSVG